MKVEQFLNLLPKIDFFTGVPDSKIKPFCNYLVNKYYNTNKLTIAVNEGNAVSLAAGFYLATNKYPCVFMQNSGIGNIVNPVTSLTDQSMFGIPIIYVIGWRGEPNKIDAPQHIKQGSITKDLLNLLGIYSIEVDKDTTSFELKENIDVFNDKLAQNKSVAILVKDKFFDHIDNPLIGSNSSLTREQVISKVLGISGDDIIVSTTGKTSRELFELRKQREEGHFRDFLIVGSMGHASAVSLGVAINTKKRVWMIDGDGSLLMHMGAMALIGTKDESNIIHIVINNGSHESVGNYPTIANKLDLCQIAKGFGYQKCIRITKLENLDNALAEIKNSTRSVFLEIRVRPGSRSNLGRPSFSPKDNKVMFMNYIKEKKYN